MSKRRKKPQEESITNFVQMYFKEIGKYTILTEKKTREYIKAFREADTDDERNKAQNILLEHHQQFIISIAKKYATEDNLLDYIGEGNLGFIKAIECFDLDKGNRFITYATFWVRKYIINYRDTVSPMIVPPNVLRLSAYLPILRKEFWIKNERNPTSEEIKDALYERYGVKFGSGDDFNKVRYTPITHTNPNSKDESILDDPSFIRHTSHCDIDESLEDRDQSVILEHGLGQLNARERYIIDRIYGLGGIKEMSYAEIGDSLGICSERVRQITKLSLKKMRKSFENYIKCGII